VKKIIYILPALLLLWGAGFSLANASAIFSGSSGDGMCTSFESGNGNFPYTFYAEQFNSGSNTSLGAVSFFNYDTAGSNDVWFTLFNSDHSTVIANSNKINAPYATTTTWTFSPSVTLTSNTNYWLAAYTLGNDFGFSSNSSYPSASSTTGEANYPTLSSYPTTSWQSNSGANITCSGGGSGVSFGWDILGPTGPFDAVSISSPTNGATAVIPTSTIIHYSTSATSTIPNVESYHVYSRLWTTDPNTYISAGGYFDPNAEPNGATTTIPYPSTLQLAGATTYTEQSYLDYCVSGMTFTCYPLASSSLVAFSTPYSNSANDQVAITAPAASSTTSNLQNFGLNFRSTFTGFNYEVDVNVSTSSAMTSSTLAGLTYTGGQSSLTPLLVANNMPMASGTTYYAQASSIYYPGGAGVGTGNLVATSSVISFTASADYAGNPSFYIYGTSTPPTPSSTATSSAWTLDCTNYGLVGNSLCSVLGWLFVPPANVLNAYLGTIQLIKTKAPFGYFFIIANDIQQINDSSTPAFSFESSGVLSQFSGAFGLADEYLGIGLVVLFMFWLFHRFRKIQL